MGGVRWWICLVLIALCWKSLEACSCMLEHPQTHYCNSDFVIVATVKRFMKPPLSSEHIYRLKIRKEFKMSDKARLALKAGRLFTANSDSMCGVSLKTNHTYLLTGKIFNLRAHVNLCNYVKLWRNVTPRQRKGFRMLYKQGCPCRIQQCFSPLSCSKSAKSICRWADPFSANSCHSHYGICLINRDGQCHWAKATRLSACLRQKQLIDSGHRRY